MCNNAIRALNRLYSSFAVSSSASSHVFSVSVNGRRFASFGGQNSYSQPLPGSGVAPYHLLDRLYDICALHVHSVIGSRPPPPAVSGGQSGADVVIPVADRPEVLLAGDAARAVFTRDDYEWSGMRASFDVNVIPISSAAAAPSRVSSRPSDWGRAGSASAYDVIGLDDWMEDMCGRGGAQLPPSFYMNYSKRSSVPLEAARVSLPSEPGTVPLLDSIPHSYAMRYSDPSGLLAPGVDPSAASRSFGPPTAHGCARVEYVALLKRMRASGMLGLTSAPKCVNGLFAVKKDADTQRLIIDARYANSLFLAPDRVALPTPDVISELVVRAEDTLYVAKCDLSDFYHSIALPEWMAPYFCLPAVTYRELGIDLDGSVYPMSLTLPMGFSHAVLLAQLAHEHVIGQCGLFRNVVPIARLAAPQVTPAVDRMLIYIDDVAFFGTDPARLALRQQQYIDAVARRRFKVKQSKTIAPTALPVDCVGITVDGTRHTAGLSFDSFTDLVRLTTTLIGRRYCTGKELSSVVGHWTWAFLCCRSAFSIFSAVYRFIEVIGFQRVLIWRSVVEELATAIDIVPLIHSSLSLPVLSTIVCSDASNDGQGVVTTDIDPNTARVLATSTISSAVLALSAERSPGMVDALSASIEPDLLSFDRAGWVVDSSYTPSGPFSLYYPHSPRFLPCTTTHRVAENVIQSRSGFPDECTAVEVLTNPRFCALYDGIAALPWRTVVGSRWRYCTDEHINSKELRAVETAIRSLVVNQRAADSRCVLFTDSTVALFALSKGRSSSHHLLRRTRSIAALLLASGIRPYYRYIHSILNPADAPSREFSV